ncbi:MAG: uracil-DNA glycosylase family protein [Verrucomicrobiota bacterium]
MKHFTNLCVLIIALAAPLLGAKVKAEIGVVPYYLADQHESVTANVANFRDYLPGVFPLPHPSPLNRGWFKRNAWFDEEVLAELRNEVANALS